MNKSSFLRYQSDEVVYADFHANLHTFITNLVKVGIQPKLAQSLARHSDIRLTVNIYSHVEKGEQTDAIGKLHSPRMPQTGTGGTAIDSEREPKPKNNGKPESPPETRRTAQHAESGAGDFVMKESKEANPFALQFAQTIRGGGIRRQGEATTPPKAWLVGRCLKPLICQGLAAIVSRWLTKKRAPPGGLEPPTHGLTVPRISPFCVEKHSICENGCPFQGHNRGHFSEKVRELMKLFLTVPPNQQDLILSLARNLAPVPLATMHDAERSGPASDSQST